MTFSMDHININVTDLTRSKDFYQKALNMYETTRKEADDGSFVLVFMSDQSNKFNLELTWLKEKSGMYELGDNETHIAYKVDDYDAAHKLHEDMGVICFENKKMGIYFIEDPDGYWLEIVPLNR